MFERFTRAVSSDHIRDIEECIKERVDINKRDEHGDTPLIRAASNQSIQALRCLTRNAARLEQVDTKGQTALHCAVEYVLQSKY